MPPKETLTSGMVSAISKPHTPKVMSLACRIARAGILNHQVSSSRRPFREVRRSDHLSMPRPSSPNSDGSTVTDSSAAKPTAEMDP